MGQSLLAVTFWLLGFGDLGDIFFIIERLCEMRADVFVFVFVLIRRVDGGKKEERERLRTRRIR